MAKKKISVILDSDTARVILIVLGSIFSTLVLSLSILSMFELKESNYTGSAWYLFAIFIVLGLSRLVTFIKERTKVSFIRFLSLFIFDVAIGIIAFFGKNNPYFFSICGGLFCISLILSRVFKIVQKPSLRNIIFNAILIVFLVLLALGLFMPYEGEDVYVPVLIVCFIVSISALAEVLSNAMNKLQAKVLFKIIIRTYALEVILGLATIMVAAALVFMFYEPTITNFGDGLWYAFAVVTTIGFGDFSAQTIVGRIVTVLLGIYGIVVVAVITSIIVNFYNETAGKHDQKEIKEIKKEHDQK